MSVWRRVYPCQSFDRRSLVAWSHRMYDCSEECFVPVSESGYHTSVQIEEIQDLSRLPCCRFCTKAIDAASVGVGSEFWLGGYTSPWFVPTLPCSFSCCMNFACTSEQHAYNCSNLFCRRADHIAQSYSGIGNSSRYKFNQECKTEHPEFGVWIGQ
jgi:hypothetical protein